MKGVHEWRKKSFAYEFAAADLRKNGVIVSFSRIRDKRRHSPDEAGVLWMTEDEALGLHDVLTRALADRADHQEPISEADR